MESSPGYFDRRDFAPCDTLHFRPEGALVGDASFFREGDECHMFYLTKRNDDPPRLPRNQVGHAVTRDLLHWERLPPALSPGAPGEADETGIGGSTIVPAGGVYHMFYAGTVNEVIYHAQSDDLITWKKDAPLEPVIVPDPRWYTPHNIPPEQGGAWRDPFCFYDEKNGQYVMLVTARLREGPFTERGCVGLSVSRDLENWEVKPPLYSPSNCMAPEVSEIFQLDGRWYLLYSHVDTFTCRYRVADRPEGPYLCPPDDMLLAPWVYAPRSLSRNGKRYLIPWVADHLCGRDGYQPDYAPVFGGEGFTWGGCLGTPQLMRATREGGIGLYYPDIIDELLGESLITSPAWERLRASRGDWRNENGRKELRGSCDQGMARVILPARGSDFRISCKVTVEGGAAAGLILRAGEEGDAGYYVRLEPGRNLVSLWRMPRQWVVSRPLVSRHTGEIRHDRTMELKVLVHRHVLDAYVDDRHVFSTAVHDYKEGHFGVFVEDSRARFSELDARTLIE